MDAISYIITFVSYELILSFFPFPYVLLLIFLLPILDNLPTIINFVLIVPVLVWYFFCSFWLAHNATIRRLTHYGEYWASFGGALSEGKMYLAFIPVIGFLFESNKDVFTLNEVDRHDT
ncbi:hypothetical protein [Desulfoluna spongiiphila]|uniref:Uncharacterized protein n=1 Tax=Desulfoluna spongiiphila TaxID=419481 RepID=A0A1G5DGL9_9BACT|nr:hypothetical protein [Desulfoluna spongiiphila]SCY13902.1 hypothetical protein SAMN05216233_104182 [Desulfoluna spongiiphila]